MRADWLSGLLRSTAGTLLLLATITGAVLWFAIGMPTPAEIEGLARGHALITPADEAVLASVVGNGVHPTFEKYHRPNVDPDPSGVVIGGSGDQAEGIYFRFQLDPSMRYRLTMTGRTLTGTTTLRTRHDDADALYHPPMEGTDSLAFTGTTEYEVLLYFGPPSIYLLESISVALCTDCRVDSDLRELISESLPGLEEQVGDRTLQGARRILDWVANAGDYALSASIHERANPRVARANAAGIYYEIFLPDAGGVYCGGYSIFLNKVFRLFGYDSFTINYGDLNDALTHVTVVVPVRQQTTESESPSSWRFYFFDPTFNGTYVDPNSGDQLSVRRMLELIANDAADGIRLEELPVDRREFLAVPDEETRCPVIIERTDKLLICEYPRFGIDQYLADWEERLVRNGYSTGVGGLFELMLTRVFSVGPSPAFGASEAFVTMLGEFGIPVGA
jgi:hypothetical protein